MGTFADNNAKFLYRELVQRYGKRAKMEVRTVHRWRRQPLSVQDLQDIKTKLRNIGANQLPPRNDLKKWEEVLKKEPTFQYGTRQMPKDIEGGEPYDRARFNRRGSPDDAANRGGFMDFNKPVQEAYENLGYRVHLGPVFGMINRTVEKHEKWALRDKRNKDKNLKWAQILRDYNSGVKQMILDSEAREKSGN